MVYLEHERGDRREDPPFLYELAHYEWVELALTSDTAEPPDADLDQEFDLLESNLYLSPVAWPLAYRFPVHRIGPQYQPRVIPDEPTYLLVYRDAQDEVRFLEINAFTFRLLEILREVPGTTGRGALRTVIDESKHPDSQRVIDGGGQILVDLRQRGVITLLS